MTFKQCFLLTCCLLPGAGIPAQAEPSVDPHDTFRIALDDSSVHTVYRDHVVPHLFHYIRGTAVVAQHVDSGDAAEGIPQFSLIRYQSVTDTGLAEGGILQFALSTTLPAKALAAVRSQLANDLVPSAERLVSVCRKQVSRPNGKTQSAQAALERALKIQAHARQNARSRQITLVPVSLTGGRVGIHDRTGKVLASAATARCTASVCLNFRAPYTVRFTDTFVSALDELLLDPDGLKLVHEVSFDAVSDVTSGIPRRLIRSMEINGRIGIGSWAGEQAVSNGWLVKEGSGLSYELMKHLNSIGTYSSLSEKRFPGAAVSLPVFTPPKDWGVRAVDVLIRLVDRDGRPVSIGSVSSWMVRWQPQEIQPIGRASAGRWMMQGRPVNSVVIPLGSFSRRFDLSDLTVVAQATLLTSLNNEPLTLPECRHSATGQDGRITDPLEHLRVIEIDTSGLPVQGRQSRLQARIQYNGWDERRRTFSRTTSHKVEWQEEPVTGGSEYAWGQRVALPVIVSPEKPFTCTLNLRWYMNGERGQLAGVKDISTAESVLRVSDILQGKL